MSGVYLRRDARYFFCVVMLNGGNVSETVGGFASSYSLVFSFQFATLPFHNLVALPLILVVHRREKSSTVVPKSRHNINNKNNKHTKQRHSVVFSPILGRSRPCFMHHFGAQKQILHRRRLRCSFHLVVGKT